MFWNVLELEALRLIPTAFPVKSFLLNVLSVDALRKKASKPLVALLLSMVFSLDC